MSYKERSRESERDRGKDRERHSNDRDRARAKDSDRREAERYSRAPAEKFNDNRRHEHRERDRHEHRDRREDRRDRRRDRSRSDSRDRHRSRHKSRERDRDRQEPRDRLEDEKSRDGHSGSGLPGDSSRKRHKTEDERPQQQQQQQQASAEQQQQTSMTAEEKEAAIKKKREEEQLQLDAEMEVRRKRVEEWRKKRAAEAAAAELERKLEEEAAAAAAAAAGSNKGWSLEDDEDDEEPAAQQGEDEVDPLDAFMAGNTAAVAPVADEQAQQPAATADQQDRDADMTDAAVVAPAAAAAAAGTPPAASTEPPDAAEEEDEVDPLDAFMAAQVMPEVAKVRFSEPAAAAVPDAEAGDDLRAAPGAEGGAAPAEGSRPATPSSGKQRPGSSKPASNRNRQRRFYDSDSSDDWSDTEEDEADGAESEEDDATWAKNVTAGKLSKGEKLLAVDHSQISYPSFRRSFYIEVPEIKRLTEPEIAALRKELDGIKVRGRDPPRPIRAWTQTGISSKVLDILRKNGFERPLAIQAQALPIIMSGRDCIGIAKTGSGKTMAFVLPMIRHIKDQPPLANGDGPVALIMAPTRELVQQISKEVKRLGRPVGLTSVAVFGGSGVANQISELKRGTEVVAATPGRLIDLLVSGGGKITNLRRVTYLVMDEADRMFDMGFEPQIMRIVGNIRPDRQTVMFSATFPRSVETLARQVLQDPVEIQVGGRSVVNSDIAQFVEIRPDGDRFLRLLEILGEWYEAGKIIIFVHTQDKCDNLFRDLLKSGYPCLSLHGGKEQSDRECTIADFKGAVCNILVATSVAARGLDVRELVLVVNYDVPNHHEDYVHRVGRTGRAGNKGTAITFIGPDEERYAPDLVKALKESSAAVPQDLQALADAFNAKRKAGLVQGHGSGYGGSGYKFDKEEDAQVKAARKSKAKEFGMLDGEEDEDKANKSDDDDIRPSNPDGAAALPGAITIPAAATAAVAAAAAAAAAAANGAPGQPAGAAGSAGPKFLPAQPGHQFPGQAIPQSTNALLEAAKAAAAQAMGQAAPAVGATAGTAGSSALAAAQAAAMRAAALAAAFAQGGGAAAPAAAALAAAQAQKPKGFESELEINDFPQNARWKVTHKGFQAEITELTGAAVTTKGVYIKSGEPPEGERKLFLLIEAPTEAQVRRAKQEIRKVIEEHVEKAMRRDTGAAGGRYNIM